MMIGTLSARPKITSVMLPLAAAAIATELSRLITKSAMMIVRTASNRLPDCLTVPSSISSSSARSLTPIQISSNPPISFSDGTVSRVLAKNTRMQRRTMAPAVPHRMPSRFCRAGRLRQASAMMMALSPPRTMSIAMIWRIAMMRASSIMRTGHRFCERKQCGGYSRLLFAVQP